MPYNYRKMLEEENSQKYPLIHNGQKVMVSGNKMTELIRNKLRNDVAVIKMFEQFEVSMDQLDELNIQIVDLEGRFAETDAETMSIDQALFEDGRFFEDSWFIIPHEIIHFLSRKAEEFAYMNDPEEVLGFTVSIASEIARGTDFDTIYNRIYPKVEFHFNSEEDSRQFFLNCITKAKKILA